MKFTLLLFAVSSAALASAAAAEKKRVLIWVANPNNVTRNNDMITDLKAHRRGFTAIAYQAFAVCGEGSDDVGGSNDCAKADATGAPHLAPGHPTKVPADLGKQLRAALGDDLELWPVISYGNPGNASVLNKLLNDADVTSAFVKDAIATAHAQNLTGYNLDLETGGMGDITAFLKALSEGLHGASPPIGVSYDAGNTPTAPDATDMTRWVSMATYVKEERREEPRREEMRSRVVWCRDDESCGVCTVV